MNIYTVIIILTIPASVVALTSSASGYLRRVSTLSKNFAISTGVHLMSEVLSFVHQFFGYQSYIIQAYFGYVKFLCIA